MRPMRLELAELLAVSTPWWDKARLEGQIDLERRSISGRLFSNCSRAAAATWQACPSVRLLAVLVTCLALAGLAIEAPAASGVIGSVALIDGPSADVIDVGGVAMAGDGTGGIVYRKRIEGRARVLAAQFVNGAWRPPQVVDQGQRFDSSWPVIAAGDGGRLVVVWAHEFGAADRLFSATLQPGARRFQAPVPVDLNIGDAALGTWPSVSMNPGGQAWLAYRVITDPAPATAPPGTVLGEIRAARFNGELWTGLGAPLNRNPAAPQAAPTQANRPQVRTDVQGNAVLAWQEADDDLTDRVFARRLFPTGPGIVLPVSPREWQGRPVRSPADQFALSGGGFGQATVAFRQRGGQGSAFPVTRVLAASVPEVFAPDAAAFGAPVAVDGAGDEGPGEGVGPVDVASTGDGTVLAGFSVGTGGRLVETDGRAAGAATAFANGGQDVPDPVVELGASGAAAMAARTGSGGGGNVLVRERRRDGVGANRRVSAPGGGRVTALLTSGSGLGDALVAFQQGTGGGTQVAAVAVDAPPDVFNVQTPLGFTRARRVAIGWDPAEHAIGGVTYTVTIDDETLAEGLRGLKRRVNVREIDDGRRSVRVIAVDAAGQETTSNAAVLQLDRRAPRVQTRVRGRTLTVTASDGRRKRVAGMASRGLQVRVGGGRVRRGRTRVRAELPGPGRHRVTMTVRDRAGNGVTVRRTVTAS
jgi:hypothetical protein